MSTLDRTTPPPVAAITDISISPERIITLSNGIRLHIVEMGEQPLSRLSLVWDGGSLEMPSPILSAIMLECIKEGTAGMEGAEIADCLDFNGARLSTRASEHHSGMDLLSLNSRFERVLPTLRSIITEPTFADKAIDMLLQRFATMRAVQLSRVAVLASNASLAAITGPNHPASHIVQPDEIMALSRQDIIDCYNAIIGGGHIHAYLAGAPDATLIAQVKDFLESLPAASGDSIIKFTPYAPLEPRRINIAKDDAQQTAVSMVLPSIMRNHPDYIDLRIAIMALGGYFGSRLMSNIREEKGLTYGISASLCGNYEGAYVEIDAQCDASFVEQVVEESRKEIASLWENPPRDEELHRIKLRVWSSLASIADTPFATSDYYITRRIVGTTDSYFQDQMEALKNLTSHRIAEIAKKHLNPDALTVAIAGPC